VSRFLVAFFGLAGFALASTPKYPMPYQAEYPFGHKSVIIASEGVQAWYTRWKKDYYEECTDGQRARIDWLDPGASGTCDPTIGNCTVSEGMGYGMLITVYADNSTNQTQAMFDKLWAFYQNKVDGNGLMNWEVNGCDNGTVATGAATDADVDVALALSMAYRQWGDSKYLTAAQTQLGHIWAKEVNASSFLFTPDDQGTANLFDPSYFATGAARVFSSVDNNSAHQWGKVADACLAFIAKNQNSTTGLMSDWADGNATPQNHNNSGTTQFGYDAVRTPWRVGLDYLWFGTPAAKTILDKIDAWIHGATSSNFTLVKANYSLNGSSSATFSNASYDGAFAMSAVAQPADTTWDSVGYTKIYSAARDGTDDAQYYNDSWRVFYLLTLSGNFQNLWGTVQPSGIVPSNSTSEASWSAAVRSGTVELRGSGEVRAQLVDLSGRVLSQASGVGSASLSRPQGRGVWLVRILGDHPRTLSVVAN
jgi:endo-1,4-beta-D-glucanase Y